uniref:Uncharacterized protein n=1 Tax=Parascaris equorum TaxID=6256 RepID=A0A914SGK4_PAREQ
MQSNPFRCTNSSIDTENIQIITSISATLTVLNIGSDCRY